MGLISNKSSWFKKEVAPVQGGILTAASNIIFYGNLERWFKALNSETGEELWKFQISSGVVGNTFTYGHKGKQYVGVLSGVGSKW